MTESLLHRHRPAEEGASAVAASSAPLWLLDEPLNALDADGARKLGGVVERHLEAGGAVLAASHQKLGGEWRKLELGA